MSRRVKVFLGAAIGLVLGAGLGQLAGSLVRSDNLPFFAALGAVLGVCIGLAVTVFSAKPHRDA